MASARCASVLALAAALGSGLGSRVRPARFLAVLQQADAPGSEATCIDTAFGAKNTQGHGCDYYSPALCTTTPKLNTQYFDPAKHCCICGGGQRREEEQCPKTCWDATCDDWVANGAGNTCANLESEYGCDCTGCSQCALETVPEVDGYEKLGVGFCNGEASETFTWVSAHVCAAKCTEIGSACHGFAVNNALMHCHLYAARPSAVDGQHDKVCYAKQQIPGPEGAATDAGVTGEGAAMDTGVAGAQEEAAAAAEASTKAGNKSEAAVKLSWMPIGLVDDEHQQVFQKAADGFRRADGNEVLLKISSGGILSSTIGMSIGGEKYQMKKSTFKAKYHIVKKAQPKTFLFTAMKVVDESGCRELGLDEACDTWIVTHGKSSGTVLYRAVKQDTAWSFYSSADAFKQHPDAPAASAKEGQVTVARGEDAALLLAATDLIMRS